MNWGLKILFAYLIFVAGIMYLVIKASGEHFDMVEPDYYQAELKFQKRIDQQKRAAALTDSVEISKTNNEGLNIVFPDDLKDKRIKGEVFLYSPSDAKKDLKKSFECIGNLPLSLPEKPTGYYRIKIEWEADGVSYFHEESMMF
jgi:hypothetical protein